ncbi:MAG TPA: hypothetical protein VFK02_05505 [Kofleriaceae bacterium]|nr:hypothetical protein [Kofleriaceae bacterium]
MAHPLRIPAVLACTVLGAGIAAAGCGKATPKPDAACVFCVPIEGSTTANCTTPICATGEHQDICPEGCEPQPPS